MQLFQYGDGSIDTEAQRFLYKLKNETVPGVLHPSNIKDLTVSWGPGITLEQHADYMRYKPLKGHLQLAFCLGHVSQTLFPSIIISQGIQQSSLCEARPTFISLGV